MNFLFGKRKTPAGSVFYQEISVFDIDRIDVLFTAILMNLLRFENSCFRDLCEFEM